MIVEFLLNTLQSILEWLAEKVNFPSLPDGVAEVIDTLLSYMLTGIRILGNYVDLSYLLILFGFVVAFDIAVNIYRLVMFVIKKIPVIDIK